MWIKSQLKSGIKLQKWKQITYRQKKPARNGLIKNLIKIISLKRRNAYYLFWRYNLFLRHAVATTYCYIDSTYKNGHVPKVSNWTEELKHFSLKLKRP